MCVPVNGKRFIISEVLKGKTVHSRLVVLASTNANGVSGSAMELSGDELNVLLLCEFRNNPLNHLLLAVLEDSGLPWLRAKRSARRRCTKA